MSSLDWWADYTDPIGFQEEVLSWLGKLGVVNPREAKITDVRVERDGEGAAVTIHRYATPLNHSLTVLTDRMPLSSSPPRRPT